MDPLTSPRSKCFISRSALTSFILEVAQSYEKGIEGLVSEFADEGLTTHGCNWIVTSVDPGTADPYRACIAVATVERVNSEWLMVKDGSELDGQTVETPSSLH